MNKYSVKFEVARKAKVARTTIEVDVKAEYVLEAIEKAREMLDSKYEYKLIEARKKG